MTGTQSWGDPGQSRESGGTQSEHATYAASSDPQPADRSPSHK